MNWLWLLSLLIYGATIWIAIAIGNRANYERGVRHGMSKKLYIAFLENEKQQPKKAKNGSAD